MSKQLSKLQLTAVPIHMFSPSSSLRITNLCSDAVTWRYLVLHLGLLAVHLLLVVEALLNLQVQGLLWCYDTPAASLPYMEVHSDFEALESNLSDAGRMRGTTSTFGMSTTLTSLSIGHKAS